MSDVRVPKSMHADLVLFAFRYGVVNAMRRQGIYPRNQMSAYQQAPRSAFLLADRITREWVRRHPQSHDSGSETNDA